MRHLSQAPQPRSAGRSRLRIPRTIAPSPGPRPAAKTRRRRVPIAIKALPTGAMNAVAWRARHVDDDREEAPVFVRIPLDGGNPSKLFLNARNYSKGRVIQLQDSQCRHASAAAGRSSTGRVHSTPELDSTSDNVLRRHGASAGHGRVPERGSARRECGKAQSNHRTPSRRRGDKSRPFRREDARTPQHFTQDRVSIAKRMAPSPNHL